MTSQSIIRNRQSAIPSIEGNVLFCGDNLSVLQRYVADESVDLIYLDPPFNSGVNYGLLNGRPQRDGGVPAFADVWRWDERAAGDYERASAAGRPLAQHMAALRLMLGESPMLAYLTMIAPRLVELHRVMKDEGSLYLHCNPTASHYLKLLLDALFGAQRFQNELIWHYQTGGGTKRRFSRKHDVIFFYTKSDKWKFYAERIAIPRTEKARERARRAAGARIAADDATKNPHDVLYVQQMNPMARERRGYPTQKPEQLLERLILASSDEGDTILDPCCGSGTTLAVAERLGRRWVGIDEAAEAISMTRARLEGADYQFVADGDFLALWGTNLLLAASMLGTISSTLTIRKEPAVRTNFWMGFAQVALILFAAAAVLLAAQKLVTPANYYRLAAIATVATSSSSFILNPTPTQEYGTVAPPALVSGIAKPGGMVTYNLVVSNHKASTEYYRLTAHSSAGWADLSALPASFSLEAGSSTHFSVSVKVPAAASGQHDETSITVSSTVDGAQESSLLTTSACNDCGR